MRKMAKHFFSAIATLIGITIGAGILGIPYAIARCGFLTGVIMILLIGFAVLFMNLYTGEVALRTKGSHQLTGYAYRYYGKFGKYFMTLTMIFYLYGALTAYIIKEGHFLFAVLNPVFGGSEAVYSIIFFVIFSMIVYIGLRAIEKSELWMGAVFIIIIIMIFLVSLPHINLENILSLDIDRICAPYGVILFSLFGVAGIPEIREELKGNEKKLKKAIIIGSLIPIFVYILFAFSVVGVTGPATTDGAIEGLRYVLGYNMFLLGIVFGILAMATSFITVALALKEVYMFDFKLSKHVSSTIACFVPLIISMVLIFSPIENAFFQVIDISGIFGGSLMAIFLCFVYLKARKHGERKPEYFIKTKFMVYVIMILFLAGLVYKAIEIFLLK